MTRKTIFCILAVGIGGALGTLFRYAINLQLIIFVFPLATLIENIIGSFVLGILTGWVVHLKINEMTKVGIGVGLCGGFTTMSTFALDFFQLIEADFFILAVLYFSASILGGITFALFGFWLGEKASLRNTSIEIGESE